MADDANGRTAKLRRKAAGLRRKAESADCAERQTMLLEARMLDDRADLQERWHGFDGECPRSGIEDSASGQNNSPRTVEWFQGLWFGGMIIGGVYDLVVAEVGDELEVWGDILLFGTAAALMYFAVRTRSKLARLLVIPFLVVTFLEVFSHDGYDAVDLVKTSLAVVQLTLMLGAATLLYTPTARNWFSEGARPIG